MTRQAVGRAGARYGGLATPLVLLTLIACVGASSRAFAEDPSLDFLTVPDYARGGYYIAAGGIGAIENSPDLPGTNASFGGNIRLGNRHTRMLATEMNILYVHNFETEVEKFLAWGLGVNERIYLLSGRVQPHAILGVGFLQLSARNPSFSGGRRQLAPGFSPGFSARFGIGFDVYSSESFAVTFDGIYHLTVGHIADHDFVTMTLGMLFN